jgi:hypothetical protein
VQVMMADVVVVSMDEILFLQFFVRFFFVFPRPAKKWTHLYLALHPPNCTLALNLSPLLNG